MSSKTRGDVVVLEDVQPLTTADEAPDMPASKAAASPQEKATATRARSRKRDPVAVWETRMRKAEANARRCLDAAGAEPRRVVVTLSPGEPLEFGGVSSSSIHARCIRDALAGLGLRDDVRRRHTFFDAP